MFQCHSLSYKYEPLNYLRNANIIKLSVIIEIVNVFYDVAILIHLFLTFFTTFALLK